MPSRLPVLIGQRGEEERVEEVQALEATSGSFVWTSQLSVAGPARAEAAGGEESTLQPSVQVDVTPL